MSKVGVDAAVEAEAEAEAEAGHKRWWRWPRPRAESPPATNKLSFYTNYIYYDIS
jgi:hypothetical protein